MPLSVNMKLFSQIFRDAWKDQLLMHEAAFRRCIGNPCGIYIGSPSEINDSTAPSSINITTSHPSPRNTNRPKTKRNNHRTLSKRHKATNMQAEDTVINLSNVHLLQPEIKLLSRRLTFVPTPQRINWPKVQADINKFARHLSLRYFFADNDNTTDADNHLFWFKGSWTPPCRREPALDAFINAIQQDLMFSQPTPHSQQSTKRRTWSNQELTESRRHSY